MLTVVCGGFFGDEGKGKISAYLALADDAWAAVRVGSVNAGHTVVHNGVTYRLRMVPSGFVNRRAKLYIAPGALLRLDVFFDEVERLDVRRRLFVDFRTGVIEERHVEAERRDSVMRAIGSTVQGVGAATADRVMRRLRLAESFEELKPFLADVPEILNDALDRDLGVIVEGTQGLYLSLYHGTYPYVTSRDTSASAVLSEVGIGPKKVDEVIVVFKSYVTRVGEGPLPGEYSADEMSRLGIEERGTITGRLRRAAPFNLELARRSIKINSATQVAITRLDTAFRESHGARRWEDLPREARAWLEDLEDKLKVPITLVSTGADLMETVDLRKEKGLL